PVIVSGESGASGFGAMYDILTRRPEIRKQLGIGSDSVILCISTEGDTCRENYIDIVENGKYPVE
ncbi:MAG: diaminopropionate ammonia-lyase, partial [Clostridia bacterium]|nr:diaminopropionate ammonia-lyase [Clostridia bacterium]